jgi:hypothetical protein
VLVGVVIIDGWPITLHVFRGNGRDAMTVPQMPLDLERRFGLRRLVFVGDRGMVTSVNVDLLRARRQGYVVAPNRRRHGDVYRYIARATGPWLDCPVGITAREKSTPPTTRVQEVASDHPGVRIFFVDSEERLAYERTQHLKDLYERFDRSDDFFDRYRSARYLRTSYQRKLRRPATNVPSRTLNRFSFRSE